ncbi:MAG: NYN domain-containing protein [Gemmatimonadetes bacterium]|nr:NYN domain-containing protein [Gemmatimonadota bacterium]
MTNQFARVAYSGKPGTPAHHEPHAALLIDFDNVTMGIRSDITKELKNLLNSDIIKGKVSVQRAYADWRRYPQYVVPLAETSVDLIFAPAYGSSKKNATDIRLAIDALELVFTRPEIGVFILLSGDSDFSSLVLKLKEYGKYVIGVGIRESASDLLVQNCDEYYSYSALTGLTRAGDEGPVVNADPWELVDVAVRQMVAANDVMRSDRLKQVLLELDPNFDEKTLGFSKFNRFVTEAANRGLLTLQKMENGQFEIRPADGDDAPTGEPRAAARGGRSRGRGRGAQEAASSRIQAVAEEPGPVETGREAQRPSPARGAVPRDLVRASHDLLRRATIDLGGSTEKAVRDSDVKRRMLDLDPDWDESALGFSKFSRFLRQAHDAEVINLRKVDNGNYELMLPADGPVEVPDADDEARAPTMDRAATVGARRGARTGRTAAPPPVIAGQAAGATAKAAQRDASADGAGPFSPTDLGLPVKPELVAEYLTRAYRGIGRRSAQSLIDAVGADRVFTMLATDPGRVREILGDRRGETLIEAWQEDYRRRSGQDSAAPGQGGRDPSRRASSRRGGRGRRGGRRRSPSSAGAPTATD